MSFSHTCAIHFYILLLNSASSLIVYLSDVFFNHLRASEFCRSHFQLGSLTVGQLRQKQEAT